MLALLTLLEEKNRLLSATPAFPLLLISLKLFCVRKRPREDEKGSYFEDKNTTVCRGGLNKYRNSFCLFLPTSTCK